LIYVALNQQLCALCPIRVGDLIKFVIALFLCTSAVCMAESCNIPTLVDLSVNNIFLHDIRSQEIVIGRKVKFIDKDDSSPSSTFASSTGNEHLKLLTHYGGIGEVAEFEVSFSVKTKQEVPKLKQINKFMSGKGIHLGMNKAKLLSILGKPSQEKSLAKTVTLIYRIEDMEGKNEFLVCYGMPIYYGNYLFKNNKLFKFQFGFEYP
jgi:hypothetical protein